MSKTSAAWDKKATGNGKVTATAALLHTSDASQGQNGKEQQSKNINGREERIQNAVFKTQDLETDSVERLGETSVYRTMDIQTDDSESKSEKKR